MDNNNPMHDQFPRTYQPMEDDLKAFCERYMNCHVIAQMSDDSQFDGIIESIDEDGVTMLVPEEVDAEQLWQVDEEGADRQFDDNPDGFDNFDDYGDYDYGDYGNPHRRRFRRFRRRRFPIRFFRSLFLYPYFFPYYPYYPYYPPYPYYPGY